MFQIILKCYINGKGQCVEDSNKGSSFDVKYIGYIQE